MYGDVLRNVQASVFFGVPHQGADSAYWANSAANFVKLAQLGAGVNTNFVNALQGKSEMFDDISRQFVERAVPLTIRTFYETERLHGVLVCRALAVLFTVVWHFSSLAMVFVEAMLVDTE